MCIEECGGHIEHCSRKYLKQSKGKGQPFFSFYFLKRKERGGWVGMLSRIELSKWKRFLPTLLPSCCSFTSLCPYLFFLSTMSSPFIVFVLSYGLGGEASWVFSSFLLRKQSEKTKTLPHISFIVSSSSFAFSVYSEYKINTDGIEQSSL